MIVLPAMPEEQTASWHALLELYDVLPQGWTLIGGQLIHLHCADRGQIAVRPWRRRVACAAPIGCGPGLS